MSRVVLNTKVRGSVEIVDLEKAKKQFLNKASTYVDRETQLNLNKSLKFDGGTFPKVQKWTRRKTGFNQNSRTLKRTGNLASSHRVKIRDDKKGIIRYGATGGFVKISDRIITGGKSTMPVEASQIRTGKDGQQYIRVQNNSGQWYTKRVVAGRVDIDLPPRPYMGLNSTNYKRIESILDGILN